MHRKSCLIPILIDNQSFLVIFHFTGIRADERKVLEKATYVQSISSATAPVVPVMASVFTFLALVLTGNDLSPVDVSGFCMERIYY